MGFSKQQKSLAYVSDKGCVAITDDNNVDGGIWFRTSRAPYVTFEMAGETISVSKQQALEFLQDAIDVIQAQIKFEAWENARIIDGMHAAAERERQELEGKTG